MPAASCVKNKVHVLQLVTTLGTEEMLTVWYQYAVQGHTNDVAQPLNLTGQHFGTNAEVALAVVRFSQHRLQSFVNFHDSPIPDFPTLTMKLLTKPIHRHERLFVVAVAIVQTNGDNLLTLGEL